MRICGVIASLGAGGAERVMVELCRAWSLRGDDVTLVTLDDGTADFHAVPQGVDRRALGVASASSSALGAVRANVQRLRAVRQAIAAARPDVVVSFTDRTNVLVLLATAGLNIRVVASERIDPRHHDIGRVWDLLRRLSYPHAGALVVQTPAVAGWAQAVTRGGRVAVIPNPLRPTNVAAARAGARAPKITALGRLVHQKGFDILIDAFAAVSAAHPEWSLAIYGAGPDQSALQERIRAHGLSDRVILPGRTEVADAVLAESAVFALASRYEGFPNVLLEAMAAGCAAVATDCDSGPRDLISHEETGLLVPVGDVGALSGALSTVMRDAGLRDRIGAAAQASTTRFALAGILELWDQILLGTDGTCRVTRSVDRRVMQAENAGTRAATADVREAA